MIQLETRDCLAFYRGKRVLVTGHTGFKGAWLCRLLLAAGAEVTGYALEPPTDPALYGLADVAPHIHGVTGDIRDLSALLETFAACRPEVVFHLAAQPIVRVGYVDPGETYEVNVMGTVNLLDCVRRTPSVRCVVNITTDKVYQNREWEWAYRENDRLNGLDPYSNSKSCSELVTESFRRSFFTDREIAVITARAGNVIGGGDFARDRILPDCVRAAVAGREILIRNPHSVRPYQHVLDALYAYLLLGAGGYGQPALAGAYNIGPDESEFMETGALAALFAEKWGQGLRWTARPDGGPHEDTLLKIDCSRMKKMFHWRSRWSTDTAVEKTVEWTRTWAGHGDCPACMDRQISAFLNS